MCISAASHSGDIREGNCTFLKAGEMGGWTDWTDWKSEFSTACKSYDFSSRRLALISSSVMVL